MTMPPQPGPWPPGQPPVPPQGPPPGYYPQQPGWGGSAPPGQNNTIKWLLIGVGLLLVIAITVGVTVLVTNGGPGGNGQSTTTSASGPPVASADDNGPVEIITSEPTCQAWMPASQAMAQVQQNGWSDRNPDIPGADWTSTQRSQYEAVAKSLRQTADQAVRFAQQSPNRVVRELYEQFIAYGRAYADSVQSYAPTNNYLARAHVAAAYALDSICNAITYGSAARWSTSVPTGDPPSNFPSPSDPERAERFMETRDDKCIELNARRDTFIADTKNWVNQDPSIPASQWNPTQRAAADAVIPVMNAYGSDIAALGRSSRNPTFRDLASLVDVYVRAYANSLPTYETSDDYLIIAGTRVANLLAAACDAAES